MSRNADQSGPGFRRRCRLGSELGISKPRPGPVRLQPLQHRLDQKGGHLIDHVNSYNAGVLERWPRLMPQDSRSSVKRCGQHSTSPVSVAMSRSLSSCMRREQPMPQCISRPQHGENGVLAGRHRMLLPRLVVTRSAGMEASGAAQNRSSGVTQTSQADGLNLRYFRTTS